MITFEKLLYWTSLSSVLLPAFTVIFCKIFSPQLKALCIYFLVSVFHEFISNFSELFNIPESNVLSVHIYTIVEALIILYIYFKEFKFKNALPMILIGVAFTITALIQISPTEDNSLCNIIESTIILPFTITYLFKLSDDLSIPKLTDHYFFWINAAFLFYFSLSFISFLFYKYFSAQSDFIVVNIHWIANIIYNILLSIGIWKTRTYRP